jgi:phosphatidylethanolamine/phosphatidyl-N-methylethanolamine N-methyltransferase
MEYDAIKRIYRNYSSVYDLLFKGFFHPRQRKAISDLNIQPGARILDVGIGTGLSLPLYPKDSRVVGVDLSVDMLRQAEKKIKKLGMTHVDLMEMDACALSFADNSFDYVVATHIISVVPDPYKVIREIRRVCKPDGQMVIVNHFVSSHPVIGMVEKKCDPFFRKLGWRMDMSLEDLINEADLDIVKTTKLTKIDLWKIVHATNSKAPPVVGVS